MCLLLVYLVIIEKLELLLCYEIIISDFYDIVVE